MSMYINILLFLLTIWVSSLSIVNYFWVDNFSLNFLSSPWFAGFLLIAYLFIFIFIWYDLGTLFPLQLEDKDKYRNSTSKPLEIFVASPSGFILP